MTKRLTPVDRINARIALAGTYLHAVGWARGTHGSHGTPTDILGALIFCAPRDGYEVVAYRLLADAGYDTFWNDVICLNQFQARQALSCTFTAEDCQKVYGPNWYSILGVMKLLTLAEDSTLEFLSEHIGPADEPVVQSAIERHPSPAYEDAHLLLHLSLGRGEIQKGLWLMSDALMANCLTWPELDHDLIEVLAPIVEKLGI
jgi:hypothetical protein